MGAATLPHQPIYPILPYLLMHFRRSRAHRYSPLTDSSMVKGCVDCYLFFRRECLRGSDKKLTFSLSQTWLQCSCILHLRLFRNSSAQLRSEFHRWLCGRFSFGFFPPCGFAVPHWFFCPLGGLPLRCTPAAAETRAATPTTSPRLPLRSNTACVPP